MNKKYDGKTQGKCPKCKVAFRFSNPGRLKDAYCPDCGTKLAATTHLYQGEWRDVVCCHRPVSIAWIVPHPIFP